MSTRKTLEERIDRRMLRRAQTNIPACVLLDSYIRAELDRLARQVRKLKRECSPAKLRCHDEADFIEAYNRALADVKALIREARK